MTQVSIVYNVALSAAVGLALLVMRRRGPPTRIPAWGGVAIAGTAMAALLGEDFFGAVRLLAYGVFLHGTLLLVGTGVVFRGMRERSAPFFGVALVLSVVATDAFLLEPNWLQVSHVAVRSPRLADTLTVVLVADLQTDRLGSHERRVLDAIVAQRPDLVLLLGDYVQEEDDERRTALRDRFRRHLADLPLHAPLGVYAVNGNVDVGDWPRMFRDLPVTALEDTRSLRAGPLWLTGLAFHDSFEPTLQVPRPDSGRFHLVFGHAPDHALGDIDADLLVAGHTHGGQVRLPLLGPLLRISDAPRGWLAGRTELSGGRTLIVSRGIGMERGHAPRLRFLCRPELVVVTLVPDEPG